MRAMAAPTALPWWHPRPRLAATLLGAFALALAVGAATPDRSAAFNPGFEPSQIPRIPCGSPPAGLFDYWCGDWETDPPTRPSAPQAAFAPLGSVRLERIPEGFAEANQGKPFGDVTIQLSCPPEALYYAGTYEGGQIIACTGAREEQLAGFYRQDVGSGDLRSGSFEISTSGSRAFGGVLHQTLSGTPDNDWAGRCISGWCATEVRGERRLRCNDDPATIVGKVDPFETNVILGTPGDDVIVGTDEADIILARGGNDLVCGGEGGDVIVGNAGVDHLDGEEGGDVLQSSSVRGETESLDGGAGADRIRGGSGTDVIRPGPGRDVVEGRRGRDFLAYSEVASRVRVNLALRRATGRAIGADRLRGIEAVLGSAFDDQLVGGDGDDYLSGGGGDDTIRGLGGTDLLLGGHDDDLLDGGEGKDQGIDGSGRTRCRSIEISRDCDLVLR
jgi:RTX calcium-binding nonapeptide repeat (4 copies)